MHILFLHSCLNYKQDLLVRDGSLEKSQPKGLENEKIRYNKGWVKELG